MDREKAFDEFMQSIKPEENVLLVHHRDTDGLCSALVVSKALQKLRGKPADFVESAEYTDFSVVLEKAHSLNPDRIICVDLSIDQKKEIIQELESIAPLLLIDHHKLYNDLQSDRTVFIKAQMLSDLDGSKYPASKLSFDLCSRISDLSEEKWIACVGILGDMGYNQWKEFVDSTAKELKLTLNDFEFLKSLINAVETVAPQNFSELFTEFNSKNVNEMLKSPLSKYRKTLTESLTKWRADFKENAEFFPELELYFYVFKPEIELKSALIDSLSPELLGKNLIVVIDRGEPMLRFSARRQDFKIEMNSLLEEAVKGIEGADAGGHIPAAAGSIPREKLTVLKNNIIEILKKKYGVS